MAKLNQVIAVVNGKKQQSQAALTVLHHQLQKGELFNGLFRRYKPVDEDGEGLPDEQKLPSANTKQMIDSAVATWVDLINVVATQDEANMVARADVVVDDKVVLKQVPVTHLLFLEKRLEDVLTFVSKLPVLDTGERWTFDANSDMFKTAPFFTNRNAKKLRNHVKVEATDKFPAQVEVYNEEVKIGQYEATKFSTAIEVQRRNELIVRVRKLQEAIKFAREQANGVEAPKVSYGEDLLGFIFQ